MRAHEAGALHAEGSSGRVLAAVRRRTSTSWSAAVGGRRRARRRRRAARRRASTSGTSRGSSAPPRTSSTRTTSGPGARRSGDAFDEAFADLCGGADVYYAGKAFLCTAVARWVAEEGLRLDVCTGGELAVALRAGCPAERIGAARQQQVGRRARGGARRRVGRIVVDSFEEIDRVAAAAARLGVVAPVLVRVTVGVEAHTHEYIATAHEDQKFGLQPRRRRRPPRRSRRVLSRPTDARCAACTATSAPRSSTSSGFEVAARRVLELHAAGRPRARRRAARARPRRRLRHRLHDPARPAAAQRTWRAGHGRDRRARSAAPIGVAVPRISIEPGRAIAGPSTFTLYEVGTVKEVLLDGDASPHLRRRRRRDERQHPPRALRRRLLVHPGQPGRATPPVARAASSASTARAATSS